MSPLEIIAVLFNILGVWLTTQRIRWCWPVSVVAVLFYAWIFFEVKLYCDMLLQLVFAVLQGYGWWRWSQGYSAAGKVEVQRLPRREAIISLVAGLAGAAVLGGLMQRYTDASAPWIDALLSSLSLVASFWAARKYVASWGLWVVLDSAYVGLFLSRDLQLTAALYAGFVVLAGYGLLAWRNELRARQRPLPAGVEGVQ